MDILQPVPIEKWSLLRDSLKRNWPAYACYYNFVRNAINWKTKDPLVKVDFLYCPGGKTDASVFISTENHGRKSFLLFAFDESKDLLREVLCKTNRIDWSDSFLCTIVHENILDLVKTFLEGTGKSKGCASYSTVDNYIYFMSKEDCSKIKVEVPEECELRRIDETYVPLIHSLWPRRDTKHPEKTLEFLTTIARLNGIMQTLEEHKRKGYGKCVAQAQIKFSAEKENVDLTIITIQSNLPAQILFESMGFKRVAVPARIDINL